MHRLIFILLFSTTAFSAEVLRVGSSQTLVSISHDLTRKWKENDAVCIYQDGKELVCGVVLKSSEQLAIVKLNQSSNLVARGDSVRWAPASEVRRKEAPTRKPAAQLLQSVETDSSSRVYYHNLSGGFSVGSGFYFPMIHFQRMVHPQFAIGVMPSYVSVSTGNGSLSAFGALVTGNYYSQEYFRGLWVQIGGGLDFFSVTTGTVEQQATSFVGLATIGWRGYWDLGFNIGVAGGLQYLKDPGFSSITLSGSNVQPLVLLDIGFNF